MSSAARVLAVLVPLRIALDLLGWVELPGFGLRPAQVGGGLVAVAVGVLVALRWRDLAAWPLRAPAAAFLVAVAIAAVRAEPGIAAVRDGLLLLCPLGFVAAASLWGIDRRVTTTWTVAAGLPVVLSLAALATGDPAEHVVNGVPRLVGAYGNVHTHAITLAVATVVGLAAVPRSRLAAAVAAGAAVAVLFSWVRSAFLLVFVALVVATFARRRPAAAVALAAVLGGALLVIGGVHDRWADLFAITSGTPPAEGWGALGSSRLHIWTDAVGAWLAGPPGDVLLGRGLGGQWGLHRHLDPHSDLLSVLFQTGPLGVLALGWGVVSAAVLLVRTRTAEGALALGLVAGLAVAGIVSNDAFSRATAALWTAGVVGAALPAPGAGGGARPRRRAA